MDIFLDGTFLVISCGTLNINVNGYLYSMWMLIAYLPAYPGCLPWHSLSYDHQLGVCPESTLLVLFYMQYDYKKIAAFTHSSWTVKSSNGKLIQVWKMPLLASWNMSCINVMFFSVDTCNWTLKCAADHKKTTLSKDC